MLNLAEKIQDARLLASQKKGDTTLPYNSDAEIIPIFQRHFKDLYYMMADTAENYFLSSQDFPDITLDTDIVLPMDFYKLNDVVLVEDNGDEISLTPKDKISSKRNNLKQRNFPDISYGGGFYDRDIHYALINRSVRFFPRTSEVKSFRIDYIKDVPDIKTIFMLNAEDTTQKTVLNIPSGFYDYLVYSVAVDLLISKEDDTRDLKIQALEEWKKVMKWAQDRNNTFPDQIKQTDDGIYDPQGYGYGRF